MVLGGCLAAAWNCFFTIALSRFARCSQCLRCILLYARIIAHAAQTSLGKVVASRYVACMLAAAFGSKGEHIYRPAEDDKVALVPRIQVSYL